MNGIVESGVSRSTYDAAHEHFDAAPLRFWDRYGERTVARLTRAGGLAPGARVLDVCCGTGASALPASRVVGSSGSVVAVDVASSLLALGRRKAARQSLQNLSFVECDMAKLEFPEGSFDAIVIVFGIFFAPDMGAQLALLHRLLRPGGVLAVTTWGPRLFEPLYSEFLDSVRARRSSRDEYRPWDRISSEAEVSRLMRTAFEHVEVAVESGTEVLERPEDWWTIVLGTGFRWFVDQLDPASVEAVREESLRRAQAVRSLETNVIYALGRK